MLGRRVTEGSSAWSRFMRECLDLRAATITRRADVCVTAYIAVEMKRPIVPVRGCPVMQHLRITVSAHPTEQVVAVFGSDQAVIWQWPGPV